MKQITTLMTLLLVAVISFTQPLKKDSTEAKTDTVTVYIDNATDTLYCSLVIDVDGYLRVYDGYAIINYNFKRGTTEVTQVNWKQHIALVPIVNEKKKGKEQTYTTQLVAIPPEKIFTVRYLNQQQKSK